MNRRSWVPLRELNIAPPQATPKNEGQLYNKKAVMPRKHKGHAFACPRFTKC